ncbi:MAG: hypothetical protein ACPGTI_07890 [bacterium]
MRDFVFFVGGVFASFFMSLILGWYGPLLPADHSGFNNADIISAARVIDAQFPQYTFGKLSGEYAICIEQGFQDCQRLNETLAEIFDRKHQNAPEDAAKPVLAAAIADMIIGFDYSDPLTIQRIGFLLSKQ